MIQLISITDEDANKIINLHESHFSDLKSIDISPAKLTRSISAFSNAEGGELYIGIENDPRLWNGFPNQEAANAHIQTFEKIFPFDDYYSCTFLENDKQKGLVLKIEIGKSRGVIGSSDGTIYLRRSAQNLPQTRTEEIERLKRNKGMVSIESDTVNVDKEIIENSTHILSFMIEVVPTSEPLPWLQKQRLIIKDLPTVAGLLLFAEEPQAILPKMCGLKIYQYSTREEEGAREALMFDPISIEGNLYEQIHKAVEKTTNLIEAIRIMTPEGMQSAKYPIEALHEIITNAIIHRDYSMADDIHIRIFNNRVEIQSPGTLPAHITPENILTERFARNGAIVRIINKFPNPPNKDVGEGLRTAFGAMKTMRLKAPTIEQKGSNVLVTLKHESIGTPQELILRYLDIHETIANREAREVCSVNSENAMKHILKKMVEAEILEVIEGASIFQTSYKRKIRN